MNLQEIIIAICPTVLTIISMIGIVVKVISSFKGLKKQVIDMKDMKEVKEELMKLSKENYELKKTLNETMTVITRVKHEDRKNGKEKKN